VNNRFGRALGGNSERGGVLLCLPKLGHG
jgi:hypothetical protein